MSDPVSCPAGGRSVRPLRVVFGYPTPETFERAQRGEIALGGCIVDFVEGPVYACPRCEEQFEIVDGKPVALEVLTR